jgi:hypothetical protein
VQEERREGDMIFSVWLPKPCVGIKCFDF